VENSEIGIFCGIEARRSGSEFFCPPCMSQPLLSNSRLCASGNRRHCFWDAPSFPSTSSFLIPTTPLCIHALPSFQGAPADLHLGVQRLLSVYQLVLEVSELRLDANITQLDIQPQQAQRAEPSSIYTLILSSPLKASELITYSFMACFRA